MKYLVEISEEDFLDIIVALNNEIDAQCNQYDRDNIFELIERIREGIIYEIPID